jgi:eukaryotic-like serine/threonine-protein kinase
MDPSPDHRVLFGPFEVDLHSGELRKHGCRIKIQQQPLKILGLLLERPGELITREELRRRLWANGLHLDFEHGLNRSINKLRRALLDTADSPRFIETLPGRGYRFICSVERGPVNGNVRPGSIELGGVQAGEPGAPIAARGRQSDRIAQRTSSPVNVGTAIHIEEKPDQDAQVGIIIATVRHLYSQPIYLALSLLTLAGLGALYWRLTPMFRPPSSKGPTSVAVLGFKNTSGRPEAAWLSTALCEMLSTELALDHKLQAAPEESVAWTKRDLSLADADSFSPETLRRIRNRLGTDFVVVGSYFDLSPGANGRIRLDLRLQNAGTGETIDWVSVSGTEQEIPELAAQTGLRLRAKLGVGELSVIESQRARALLPSNAEAARLYSEGLDRLRAFDPLAARELLAKAIVADGQHALSHSALAEAWSDLGYDQKAQEEAKKAFDLSGALPRAEQLFVQARYSQTFWQWDKAVESYTLLFGFFPDSAEYGLRLANAQIAAGKGRDALQTVQRLRNLPRSLGDDPRLDLVEAHAAESLSDFKRQKEVATRAIVEALAQRYALVAADGYLTQARALYALGEIGKAATSYKNAEAQYRAVGDLAGAAEAVSGAARLKLVGGDFEGARSVWRSSLAAYQELGDQRGVAAELNHLGVACFWAGDVACSRRFFDQSLAAYTSIGNRRGIAEGLANVAAAMTHSGDLDGALSNRQEALSIKRELGDRQSIAKELHDIADLYFWKGELGEARRGYAEELPIWQEIGDRDGYSDALGGLAAVIRARGDLRTAEQKIIEVREMKRQIGAEVLVNLIDVDLARTAIQEGEPERAEVAASNALAYFRQTKNKDGQCAALATLAKSLLSQGKLDAARDASDEALLLSTSSQRFYLRLRTEITAAQVRASSNRSEDVREALRSLEAIRLRAEKIGFLESQFEARLAAGEIEMKSTVFDAGRSTLESLEREATAKGFGLIAHQASQSLLSASNTKPV